MRGPGQRLRIDVRRLWKCPQCGYERHAPANETTVRCHCDKNEYWMKLVEPQRIVRDPPVELEPYVEFSDEELADVRSFRPQASDPPVESDQEAAPVEPGEQKEDMDANESVAEAAAVEDAVAPGDVSSPEGTTLPEDVVASESVASAEDVVEHKEVAAAGELETRESGQAEDLSKDL